MDRPEQPELLQPWPAPEIPGFTDGYREETRNIAWGKVLEAVGAVSGDNPLLLFDNRYSPYCIPLLEPVTVDNVHEKLPAFAHKILRDLPCEQIFSLLDTQNYDSRKNWFGYVLWAKNLQGNSHIPKQLYDRWIAQLPEDFHSNLVVFLHSMERTDFRDDPNYFILEVNRTDREVGPYLNNRLQGDTLYLKTMAAAALQRQQIERSEGIFDNYSTISHPFSDVILEMIQGAHPQEKLMADNPLSIFNYPEEIYWAFRRDEGRIFDRHPELVRPAGVPAQVEGKFEDPLQIGQRYWEDLAGTPLPDEVKKDPAVARKYMDRQAVMGKIENNIFRQWGAEQVKLPEIRPDGGPINYHNEKNFKYFLQYQEKLGHLPAFLNIDILLDVYRHCHGLKKSQFFRSHIPAVLDSDPCGISLYKLFNDYNGEGVLRHDLLNLLKNKEKYLDYFVRLARTAQIPRIAAFAMQVLADYCGPSFPLPKGDGLLEPVVEKNNPRLKEVIRKMFHDMDSLQNPVLAENFLVFTYFIYAKNFTFSSPRSLSDPDDHVIMPSRMEVPPYNRREFHLRLFSTIFSRKEFLQKFIMDGVLEKGLSFMTGELKERLMQLPVLAAQSEENLSTIQYHLAPPKKAGQETMELLRRIDRPNLADFIRAEKFVRKCPPILCPFNQVITIDLTAKNNAVFYAILGSSNPSVMSPLDFPLHLVRVRQGTEAVYFEGLTHNLPEENEEENISDDIRAIVYRIFICAVYTHLSDKHKEVLDTIEDDQPKTPAAAAQPENQPDQKPDSTPPDSQPDSAPDSKPENQPARRNKRDDKNTLLTVDMRDYKQQESSQMSTRISAKLTENQEKLLKFLNGELAEPDLPGLLVHRQRPGIGDDQFVYERIQPEELSAMLAAGTLFAPDIFILVKTPHLCAQGYLGQRKLQPQQSVYRISRDRRTLNAELAYDDYYLKSGLPDLGPLQSVDAVLRLREYADPGNGHYSSIKYSDRDGEEQEVIGTVSRPDPAIQIMRRLDNDGYMDLWIESQERVLKQEIKEIQKNPHLSEEQKRPEIETRKVQLDSLEELKHKLLYNSHLLPEDIRKKTGASVQIGLGWVETDISFNQGTFVSMEDFLIANAGRFPLLADFIKLPPANQEKKRQKTEPEFEKNDVIREIHSLAELVTYQKYKDLFGQKADDGNGNGEDDANKNPTDSRRKKQLANAAHLSALVSLYKDLNPAMDRILVGSRSFDLLTVRDGGAFLWEVKSINTSKRNEDKQLRTALGQLLEYQFFGIANRPEIQSTVTSVTKAVLLNEKPQMLINGSGQTAQNYLEYLEAQHGIFTYWLEEGRINGSAAAMTRLSNFLLLQE